MDNELGDEYIRRIATFIRNNEQGLAAAGDYRRRRPQKVGNTNDASIFNPLGWFASASDTNLPSSSTKPVILSLDEHHLFYLLMRMEALGLDVGSLDVRMENPSRPMNYINVLPFKDRSDALSFMSITSAVSRLSLGPAWWGRPIPPSVDNELKYIYSSFTKLPALSIHAPEHRLIAELENEAPNENAVPLDAFKTLATLECHDIDPRSLTGWDRLAEGLRGLTIKRSGLEDVSDIFIGAVVDDQARRAGQLGTDRTRRIPKAPPSRQSSFYSSTPLPDAVPEDAEDIPTPTKETSEVESESDLEKPTPKTSQFAQQLPSLKWAFLRHLSLSDNALTFLPSTPLQYLTSLTHLDLSSNLLVSVPSGLSALYNLVSLNLSDNMIDSVLGIYTMLGQILILNLARNRLESICGLERLLALERVDLRHNLIDESAEIGRLATLPNIAEVWVEGNPLTEFEEGYRIRCFDIFMKEGKNILLDGTPATFYEKRYLSVAPPEQMSSSRPISVAFSPPVVAVGSSPGLQPTPSSAAFVQSNTGHSSPKSSPPSSLPPSHSASPQLAAVRGRKKRNKRIVDLDGGSETASTRSASPSRMHSDASALPHKTTPPLVEDRVVAGPSKSPASSKEADEMASSIATLVPNSPPPKLVTKHSRHRTEYAPASPSSSFGMEEEGSSSPFGDSQRSMSGHRRSATMSSKAAARRSRVSASVYEPPSNENGGIDGKGFGEAEAFRAKIEALRQDMGEGWLKVFNQSHMGSSGVPSQ
ncbi:hypothetical protein ABKN59_007198 [Abortiporus biennis]